jgi:hypothetical protein
MKQITAIALLAFAGVIGTGKALAEDQVSITAPFDFTVGNKALPAGTYSITRESDTLIAIRKHDSRDAVLSMTLQAPNQSAKNVLVFDRYNGHYFLREILCETGKMNLSLPRSKSETRARELEAKNSTDSGQVLLALK